jgi:tetratricopeptide (TPR) repeat protein
VAALEKGQLDKALDLFPPCKEEFRRLVDEQAAEETEQRRAEGGVAVHGLSGAIANYATLLDQIADNVEVATLAHSERLPADLSRVPNIDPEAAISTVATVRLRLLRLFPGGFYAENVRIEAVRLFQRAVELAESISAWDFAAIQTHHLMLLYEKLGRRAQALEYAQLTIRYAEHAHDRSREARAHAFLARSAAEAGKGAEAIEHLKKTALISIREEIALGHHANQRPVTRQLGEAAIEMIGRGADVGEAVTLVENLKAALMAPSLVVGFPPAQSRTTQPDWERKSSMSTASVNARE